AGTRPRSPSRTATTTTRSRSPRRARSRRTCARPRKPRRRRRLRRPRDNAGMDKRPLGRSGLHAAPLALGGNVFGWTADEKTSFAILDSFVDAGFSLVDTANSYSTWVPGHKGGESEAIIGRWLEKGGKRDRVVLATKVGMEVEGDKGLKRSQIEHHVEQSLKRLKTDR